MADEKKQIIGIGISGLVGSRIAELLNTKYSITNYSSDKGINITQPETLTPLENTQSDAIIFHLAAKADVDGCEQDKAAGEKGAAWRVNVDGVKNVVNAIKKQNRKIIYVSTDFVFDGENTPESGYSEENIPHPINWYAETKYRGEEVVRNSGLPFVIIRLACPYRKSFEVKKDFVRVILNKLKNGEHITAVIDHIMSPTFIDDIADAVDALVANDAEGIYHVVGSQFVSPYDAALMIAKRFDCDESLIKKTTREEYFRGKARRPFDLRLRNDKITQLGVRMKGFEEGLEEIKKQNF